MAFFKTQFNSFGLDISDGSLKLISINKNLKGVAVNSWGIKKLTTGLICKGEIQDTDKLATEIKNLIKEARGKTLTPYVVSVLPESKTFIKLFHIQRPKGKLTEDAIKNSINQELPNHIPVELENLKYDFQIIHKNQEFLKILVGAVPKNIVQQYIETLTKAGLKILALEIEAQSITRAIFEDNYIKNIIHFDLKKLKFKKNKPLPETNNEKLTIIADLGANRSSLIFWHKGTIQFTSTLEISGNEITNTIAKKLNMSFEKAEKAKIVCGLDNKKGKGEVFDIISKFFEDLVQDIAKNLKYYSQNNTISLKDVKILLSGGSSCMLGLENFIKKQTQSYVTVANPKINLDPKQNIIPEKYTAGFASAIGLALRHLIE
ncbi:MAG: type IV pilus assembly protein PilM [Patescibacteria group bacterium]